MGRAWQPFCAFMAASGLLRICRHDEAGALVAKALALSAETDDRWCDAELHRLGGEARLAGLARQRRGTKKWREVACDAEPFLRRAVEVARAQGARWWELRSAVSLARLLIDTDRSGEARER